MAIALWLLGTGESYRSTSVIPGNMLSVTSVTPRKYIALTVIRNSLGLCFTSEKITSLFISTGGH